MKLYLLLLLIPFTNPPIGYRQLTWSDFKGKPTNHHVASTCTGIVIRPDTAYAIFEPDESWTRTSNLVVLRHEQLHFAITKMYASKIAKGEKGISVNVVDYLLGQWEATELRYDAETDHGLNTEKQKEWEQKIKL